MPRQHALLAGRSGGLRSASMSAAVLVELRTYAARTAAYRYPRSTRECVSEGPVNWSSEPNNAFRVNCRLILGNSHIT